MASTEDQPDPSSGAEANNQFLGADANCQSVGSGDNLDADVTMCASRAMLRSGQAGIAAESTPSTTKSGYPGRGGEMPVYGVAAAAACGAAVAAAPQQRRIPSARCSREGKVDVEDPSDDPQRSKFGDGQDQNVLDSELAVQPEEDTDIREAVESLNPPPTSARGQLFRDTAVCRREAAQVLMPFSWLPVVGPTETVEAPSGRLANYIGQRRRPAETIGAGPQTAPAGLDDSAGERMQMETVPRHETMGADVDGPHDDLCVLHDEKGVPLAEFIPHGPAAS
mmetsp:Transcript_110437/g.276460  ORF Transcript_110437/g.276460 Transcript_110437/m.276460 type:complete len:281 (-) Transcript_110437:55-897(-)